MGTGIRVSRLPGIRLLSVAQTFGLFATAWFIWFHFASPRLARQSLAGIAAEALGNALIVWGCTAAIAFCTYIVISLADVGGVVHASIRSSAVSMWFAPAIILLSMHDPASYAASLILVVNTTRLLITRWVRARRAGMLTFEAARWPVFAGSLTIQAGLVSIIWGYPLLAATFCASSAAILTALWTAHGAWAFKDSPALPQSTFSVALTVLLALGITFGVCSRIGDGEGWRSGVRSRDRPQVLRQDTARHL